MHFKQIWQKLQYQPELFSFVFIFSLCLLSPVQEQYLYKVYSLKVGIPYSNSAKSKGSCPILSNTTNKNFTSQLHQVQRDVSMFLQRQAFVISLPPIAGILFFGPLSDQIGRKPLIILCMFGFLVQILTLIAIEVFHIDILFLHAGGFINGICGYLPGVVSMLGAYLADIVPGEKLAIRIAIIDFILFVSLGISNVLSGIILRSFDFLYTFIFMASLILVALLLAIFQLKESLSVEKRAPKTRHWITLPLKIYHLIRVSRSQKWRLKILLPVDSLSFFFGQTVIAPILMLRLLNLPFCWSATEIGLYRGTFFFVAGVGVTVIVKVVPIFFHKGIVMAISLISSCGYLLILGIFETKEWYYVGIAVGVFSYGSMAMGRSIMASYVNKTEKGSLFSLLGALQSTVILISSFLYQALYRAADEGGKPGAVFISISFGTIIPFLLVLVYIMKDVKYQRRLKRPSTTSENAKVLCPTPSPDQIKNEETDPLLG